ncbi:MAG: serine protease [Gammaproteobacteria bacterium]|nr:serine protease [Gammaproteobacteria bacterium]
MLNRLILAFLLIPINCFAAPDIVKLYEASKDSVVSIVAVDEKDNALMSGTGFYIDDGKKVVTNYHVIEKGNEIKAFATDGKEIKIKNVSHISKNKDIAILSLYKAGSPLKISSTIPKVGEDVITIGNPRGLENTLSTGIISGVRVIDGITLLQTTTPISPGSSGGPLIARNGGVVGVTTFYLKESQNVNFAVSTIDLYTLEDSNKDIDYLSPTSVAEAFFNALSKNDLDSAINFVLPEEQETFRSEFKKGIPEIPKNTPMEGHVRSGKKNGLPAADANFINSKLGVDLVNKFNRWWVAK